MKLNERVGRKLFTMGGSGAANKRAATWRGLVVGVLRLLATYCSAGVG